MKNILIIQIQLWQDCNLRCSHCWRDAKFDKIHIDVDQSITKIIELLDHLNNHHGNFEIRLHLSGGEVFLYPEKSLKYLQLIDMYDNIKIGFLTNGIIWNDEINNQVIKYQKKIYFQISIDGIKNIHNKIRGKGSFEKSTKNGEIISKLGYYVKYQVTINQDNYKELEDLMDFYLDCGVQGFGFRKILETGRAQDYKIDFQNRNKYLKSAYNDIAKRIDEFVNQNKKIYFGCDSMCVDMIQPDLSKYTGNCGVLRKRIIGIEPNGDILLCPRLPIKIGNIYKDDIIKVYENNYYQILSKNFELHKDCESCAFCNKCFGGELCEKYEHFGHIKANKSPICEGENL